MSDVTDPERSPAAWLARPRVSKPCAGCGRDFVLPTPSSRYCSPPCSAQAKVKWQRRKHGGPSKIDISPPKEG